MSTTLPHAWLQSIARLPADGGPSGAAWARTVGPLVEELTAQWELIVTGPAMTGWTAIVLPVERDGVPLALKIGWPHRESVAEHLALRHWAGRRAVRLAAADPARGGLLLERLDPTRTLATLPIDAACEQVGIILSALHVPAPPTIPPLAPWLEGHLERLGQRDGIPRRIVARTQGLGRELIADSGAARLLHTDLHFDNVLAGVGPRAGEWLAIDPKAMAGHPGFELQPVLRNRIDELGTGSGFRRGIRRRLDIVAEAAAIDPEQLRLWSIVHTGIQLGWAVADRDADGLSLHIAIFKALED